MLPTVLCGVFINNYNTDCSSGYEFYSLQSTFVLMISFGPFTSPEMEGEKGLHEQANLRLFTLFHI